MEEGQIVKSKGKLVFSFVNLLIYIVLIIVFILMSSFGEYNSIINYIILIALSLVFGFLYKWFQDGFNSSFEFRLRSSILTSTITLTIFILIIGILNRFAQATAELSTGTSFIGVIQVNLFIYSILFLLFFNLSYLLQLFKEKQWSKVILYIIPIIISQLLFYGVILLLGL